MRRNIYIIRIIFLLLLFADTCLLFAQVPLANNGKLEFTENKRQWDKRILYRTDIPHGAVFLEKSCFTYNFINPDDIDVSEAHNIKVSSQKSIVKSSQKPDILHFFAYKVHLQNTITNAQVYGSSPTRDYCNYIIGNDSSKWASHVQKFKTVTYKNIYNNIDMSGFQFGQ